VGRDEAGPPHSSTAAARLRGILSRVRRRLGSAARQGPRGAVDHPRDGYLGTSDSILVDGWTEYQGRPATTIQVLVDDAIAATTEPDVTRPDVVQALRLRDLMQPYGWAVHLDISAHERARARVAVRARIADGPWWLVGKSTVRTLGRRSAAVRGTGHLDSPQAEGAVSGDVVVTRGWAMFGSDVPSRIDVEIDGQPGGAARAQIPRPDVAEALGIPSAIASGFEHHTVVPLNPGESRKISVAVIAHHESGSTWKSPARHVDVTARPYVASTVERAKVLRVRATFPDRVGRGDDRTNLLAFTHSLAVGGGELFLVELLMQLRQHASMTCHVVSPTDGVLRPVLESWGVPVHVTGGFPVGDVDSYEGGVRQLALLARDIGAPVALVNTIGIFPAADAARLAGMEVIWSIHESFELADFCLLNWGHAGLDPLIRDRWTATLRDVSAAVFECEATSELYSTYIPDDRRLVIPYGIPLQTIDAARSAGDRAQARRALGLPQSALVLLVMATYEPRKGQGSLVEAFARISSAHPEALLVLVGDHPSEYSRSVARMIAMHGLDAKVMRVPIALDVYDWYSAADALISASDVESVPRSVLEAMRFGLPVLAAGAYGVPELIAHGRNGWLFPPRDFSALVAGMERLVTAGATERKRVGDAAHDGSGAFDSRLYAKDYGALIRGLSHGPHQAVGDLIPRRGWRPEPAPEGETAEHD